MADVLLTLVSFVTREDIFIAYVSTETEYWKQIAKADNRAKS